MLHTEGEGLQLKGWYYVVAIYSLELKVNRVTTEAGCNSRLGTENLEISGCNCRDRHIETEGL